MVFVSIPEAHDFLCRSKRRKYILISVEVGLVLAATVLRLRACRRLEFDCCCHDFLFVTWMLVVVT